MNIIDAIADPNLFRSYLAGDSEGPLDSWARWLAFLRTLYGLPIEDAERETIRRCTGREQLADGFDECLVLAGRRSGKSKMIAAVAAFEAVLSGRESRVSRGEIPMVAILSPTRNQSRIIHEYVKSVFDSTPLLSNEVAEERQGGFKLRNGVEVAILTGDHRSIRGFTLIACVVDEISMFGLSEESRVKSDTELVRGVRPALATTGGRLLCIGTPYKASGYAHSTFRRAFGNNEADVLVWNAPSTLMNPTLNPAIVQRAIDEDPVAARVEYCVEPGLFREDVDEFISRSVVESLVIRGRQELPPRAGVRYAAFADMSGGRSDDAALAIAHRENGIVILDVLERFPAPHNPYTVVGKMARTLRRYDLDRAVGDAYSAEWSRTAFKDHGIDYRRATTSVWNEGVSSKNRIAKPKSVLYSELLPRLTSGEIELLDHEILIAQLASLQRRTRSGGRDSIDHPPGGHDDCANVVAGVCDAVQQRKVVAGVGFDSSSGENERPTPFMRAIEQAKREAERFDREQDAWRNEKSDHAAELRHAMSMYYPDRFGGSPFGF